MTQWIDAVIELFKQKGDEAYLGENISMSEHMLQCAYLAEQAGESETIIAAALLHDIGHFLSGDDDVSKLASEDLYHQNLGSEFLRGHVSENVFNAVKYHVDAKRYLCAVEPEYFSLLSPASVHTLRLQGGEMTKEECRAFEQLSGYKDILKIRRFDEQGKQENRVTPDIDDYRSLLKKLGK